MKTVHSAIYKRNRNVACVESPVLPPGLGQVRIETAFCGVCGTDLHVYLGHMDQRVADPQILGHEMSGVVAEIGADVSRWSVGDRVVVRPLDPCGDCPACAAGHTHICQNLKFLGLDTPGAFQQSWTVPAHTLHRLPATVSLELGALVEPLAVACHDVRRARLKEGETAVVIGGGPIGLLVALAARHIGARVLMTEVNPFRIGLARELGLEVLDPGETDVAARVEACTEGAGADVVFEVSGSAAGAAAMTQFPRARGRIVIVGIFSQPAPVDLFRFFWRELELVGARVYQPADFEQAIRWIAEDVLPLERLITDQCGLDGLADAFRRMADGEPVMKILINLNGV